MFGAYTLTPVLSCVQKQPSFSRLGFPRSAAAHSCVIDRLGVRKDIRHFTRCLAPSTNAVVGSYYRDDFDTQHLKRSQKSGSLWGKEGCDCYLLRSRCVCMKDGSRRGSPSLLASAAVLGLSHVTVKFMT